MGPSNDPFCSYCKEAVESVSHFFCHCSYFTTLRTTVWGKPSLHPSDIDLATVGDIVWFKESYRFSSSIQWLLEYHRGWLMRPHCGLSLWGDKINALLLLEPEPQLVYRLINHCSWCLLLRVTQFHSDGFAVWLDGEFIWSPAAILADKGLPHYQLFTGEGTCHRMCCLLFVTSAEEGGYVFGSVCLSVCLSVCPSDYSQTYERILTKFFGGVGHGSRTKWYNFGGDPDHASDPGVLSPKSRSSGSAEVCALWAYLSCCILFAGFTCFFVI